MFRHYRGDNKFKVKGYIDNINKKIKNYNYLGNDEDLLKYSNKRFLIFISIGQIKNSKIESCFLIICQKEVINLLQ